MAFTAPLQVASNSASTRQTADQFYGILDSLVWTTGFSATASKSALTSYLAGLLTP